MARTITLFLLYFAAACSRDLSRTNAAEILRAHLAELAPSLVRRDSVHLAIRVDEIVKPSEGTREVRFRALFSAPDSVGRTRTDSSAQLSAEFQRSDEGWALRRYGAELKNLVAGIVAMQWSRDLAYLMTPVSTLQAAYDSLDEPKRNAALRAIERGDYRASTRLGAPIPPPELTRYIASHDVRLADSLEWGYVPAVSDRGKGVIWVKKRGTESPICAMPVGFAGDLPTQYYWVENTIVGPTCVTPTKRVTWLAMDSLIALINRQDGILTAEQARVR
jgi:hypothetical protein